MKSLPTKHDLEKNLMANGFNHDEVIPKDTIEESIKKSSRNFGAGQLQANYEKHEN